MLVKCATQGVWFAVDQWRRSKKRKSSWYLKKSTPRVEPEYITKLRKEVYEIGLNAGSFLFLAPAVSQPAACDGTMITTTADSQDIAQGTLPTF